MVADCTLLVVGAQRGTGMNMTNLLKVTLGMANFDSAAVLLILDFLCPVVQMSAPVAVDDMDWDYLLQHQRIVESSRTLWETECESQKAAGQ